MKRFKWIILGVVVVVIIVLVVIAVYVYIKLNEDAIELGRVNGDLGYMTNADGDWDVALVDPDGVETILTVGDGQDYFFNFTFNGEKVNFYTSRTGDFTPGVVNTDGSELRGLSWGESFGVMFNNKDFDPAWSPDGEQLAWTSLSLTSVSTNLMLSQADGNDSGDLTDSGDADTRQAWSPDGTQMAFIRDIGNSGDRWNVFVVEIASGDTAQVAPDDLYAFQVAWSMGGEQLLIAVEGEDDILTGDLVLMVMNADGSDLHVLGDDEVFEGDPTYSPDGTEVAYMSNEDGNWHIYVQNVDGSNLRRVTEGDDDHLFPAWRPVPASEVEGAEAE